MKLNLTQAKLISKFRNILNSRELPTGDIADDWGFKLSSDLEFWQSTFFSLMGGSMKTLSCVDSVEPIEHWSFKAESEVLETGTQLPTFEPMLLHSSIIELEIQTLSEIQERQKRTEKLVGLIMLIEREKLLFYHPTKLLGKELIGLESEVIALQAWVPFRIASCGGVLVTLCVGL